MKPKGVTTQMKALVEYFLMVVFKLLLNKVHVFANLMYNLNTAVGVNIMDIAYNFHWTFWCSFVIRGSQLQSTI